MLLESVKLQKMNSLCWKSMLSRMFSIICAPLLPATTSWKCYYLYTGNISFEWIPRLNIVHQIVRDLDYSLAIWWCKSNVFHWSSFSAVPLILYSATVATEFFDRNSSTSTFNVFSSWMWLVAVFSHNVTPLWELSVVRSSRVFERRSIFQRISFIITL